MTLVICAVYRSVNVPFLFSVGFKRYLADVGELISFDIQPVTFQEHFRPSMNVFSPSRSRCVELIICEQMNKYRVRLKDINSLEFAEVKAKSRLTLIRRSMVTFTLKASAGGWLPRPLPPTALLVFLPLRNPAPPNLFFPLPRNLH